MKEIAMSLGRGRTDEDKATERRKERLLLRKVKREKDKTFHREENIKVQGQELYLPSSFSLSCFLCRFLSGFASIQNHFSN